MRIIDVQQKIQRLNDLDDVVTDALMRKEKPSGAPVPFSHTGSALCVVVVSAQPAAFDTKVRQIREAFPLATMYEMFRGIRFFYWEIDVPIIGRSAVGGEGGTSLPREKLSKLLDGLKNNIWTSTSATPPPSLIFLDLFKRRYYRMRLNTTIFDQQQIASFCDEFSQRWTRGASATRKRAAEFTEGACPARSTHLSQSNVHEHVRSVPSSIVVYGLIRVVFWGEMYTVNV